MGEASRSVGAVVPSVKLELIPSEVIEEASASAMPVPPLETASSDETGGSDIEKDFLCPICMEIIKDAFLTSCGHSFCYMCIVRHLQSKNDCPCCAHYLTSNHLYPNFLLNKLLKKNSARQVARSATPFEKLRLALQQGCDISVKELDGLLSLLSDKKKKMEQEEAENNMQILLDFLQCLRKRKTEELNEIQNDLQFIKEDINVVERQRIDLYRVRERYSVKLRMLGGDPSPKKPWPPLPDKHSCGTTSSVPMSQGFGSTCGIPMSSQGLCLMGSSSLEDRKVDSKALLNSQVIQRKDAYSGSDPQNASQSGLAVARKKRVHTRFADLQECYLQKRREWSRKLHKHEDRDSDVTRKEGYHSGLEDFHATLSTFTRYSRLRVIAELRHGDLFHSANIVSSIEFDRDDELFATAGVSRRIKIFEFSSVVNEPTGNQCPVVEMSTRSKLSCLSWNKYTKNHIASSDYEGIVTVWDIVTRQSVMEYEEHEKRAWSVDFSRTEPSMLVSGSDDCKVKIWCTKQEASVLNIDMKAMICSVKYNPGSSMHIAVGSADHNIHYYDLRNVSQPVHIFSGHRKTVSYVKFMSNNELASASTDSTLRLWDVNDNILLRTFRGHTNEKNFVGLSANGEYVACGSETNEVFVYHKAISRPAAWHRFVSSNADEAEEDAGSYFISAVCWKSDSPTMLTANSQGTIKVLVLAA